MANLQVKLVKSLIGSTKPQLDTVLKVLAALGKTLKVVPIEQK